MEYTAQTLLRLAKRQSNTKRAYLLVNPLQGKHIPVAPRSALGMMDALGGMVAQRYPSARLVIGFAETATAIGAAVAASLGEGCFYIQTTREHVPEGVRWAEFLEEHSHAVEQKICLDGLTAALAETDTVVLVDDELTTGRTLINMVNQLRVDLPAMATKRVVAASLISRLSPENISRLTRNDIDSCSLVQLPQEDYAAAVAGWQTEPASPPEGLSRDYTHLDMGIILPDPRLGVPIGEYRDACDDLTQGCLRWLSSHRSDARVLVLGTEECMYPGLMVGRALEAQGHRVHFHATTRSPIGVLDAPDYPIGSGVALPGLYDAQRATFLYNLAAYDCVLVVSDRARLEPAAMEALTGALTASGSPSVTFCLPGEPYA